MGCCSSCFGAHKKEAEDSNRKNEKSKISAKSSAVNKKPSVGGKLKSTLKLKQSKVTSRATDMKMSLGGSCVKKSLVKKSKYTRYSAQSKNTSKTPESAFSLGKTGRKKTSKLPLVSQSANHKAAVLKPKMLSDNQGGSELQTQGFSDAFSSTLALDKCSKAFSDSACSTVGTRRVMRKHSNIYFNNRKNKLADVTGEEQTALMADRRLGRDQKLTVCAVGNEPISQETVTSLMKRKTLDKIRSDPTLAKNNPDTALLTRVDFAALSPIVSGLFLTGAFGLLKENLCEANIALIINATIELPLLQLKDLTTYRVPVEDGVQHQIDVYFDDVADLIEATRRSGYASVVHCAAGVSRSSTLVLAYLVKYTNLTLLEAFGHTRAIRPLIRPNMGFMKQLIKYERTIRGSTSVKMVTILDKQSNVKVTVPDFYPEECKELYEWHVAKELKEQNQNDQ